MRPGNFRRAGRVALAAIVAAACSHAPPSPPPPPVPPAQPVVAPHAATGTYDLTTTLPSRQPPQPSRSRGRAAPVVKPTLDLVYRPVAAPDATAGSNTQFAATLNLPGYTRAPRGRTGQAVVWWPLPGDSVIVHFLPPQATGLVDMRGTLRGDTLSGDVWYTSLGTGASFQMGTFRAIKRKR